MKNKTPLKAIRKKCLDCSGGQRKEVSLCENRHCPLFPYRMGLTIEKAQKHSQSGK